MMTIRAHAKINLTLEILGGRPDGYHDIMSVVQAISLHDTLTFEQAEAITLYGGSPDAPADESNLVLKAARALNAAVGGGHGARITLEKRIPVGAGLGGGSSDAATALIGLNELWRTGISRERLMEVAGTLGSDVPFFLGAGTALAEGRGECITSLGAPPEMWLTLAKPASSLATADVYSEYVRGPAPARADFNAYRDVSLGLRPGMPPDRARKAIVGALWNDLQPAAIRLCPEITGIQDRMVESGALGTLVCGSGSAVLGIAADEPHAHQIAGTLEGVAAWTEVAHSISLPPEATT